jgi:acyl-CoA thioesterase FadM
VLSNYALRALEWNMLSFSQQQKSIVATGEAIVVMVDRAGQKVILPEELKQTIINLEQTVGNI